MMLKVSDFVQTLKSKYPNIKFFNGCISRDEKCVGVYARGNASPITAVGTKPSYSVLPVTLLVHWGENSDDCETTANQLYEGLEQGIDRINNTRVIQIQMLDSTPVNIGRDDNNNCEMTIRINIFYERR
jgi:hypothetical protein